MESFAVIIELLSEALEQPPPEVVHDGGLVMFSRLAGGSQQALPQRYRGKVTKLSAQAPVFHYSSEYQVDKSAVSAPSQPQAFGPCDPPPGRDSGPLRAEIGAQAALQAPGLESTVEVVDTATSEASYDSNTQVVDEAPCASEASAEEALSEASQEDEQVSADDSASEAP